MMLPRLARTSRLASSPGLILRPSIAPLHRRDSLGLASKLLGARKFSVCQRKLEHDKQTAPGTASSGANEKPLSAEKPSRPGDATSENQNRGLNSVPEAENLTSVPDEIQQRMPFHELPDLTQGIPSTLEQELRKHTGQSKSALKAVEQEIHEERTPRDRQNTYIPSSERNRRWWTRFVFLTTATGSLLLIVFMGRNWNYEAEADRHLDAPNGWGLGLWWRRVRARMAASISYYQDPAFDKLLPDPDPSFQRPYTLCLSLDDLLIHSEWSREHGWRIAKRPGMDYFIHYLSQYYELVLFTTLPFMHAEPLVRKLDPFHFIMWPLFREATKFENGEIVKDLSYLNRDLSKVIIIDTNASHLRKQPENAIILDPWKGDPKDKDLVGLIPFLEYVHTMQYLDVRKILKSFEGKHIPTEFARREAIARKEFNQQLEAQKAKRSKPSGMGALGNMLGLKPSTMSMKIAPEGEQNPSEAFAQGKMLQDIARERGQRNYKLMEKEIRENGEKWLKEEQVAMEKAQKEAMSSVMGSFTTWFNKADSKIEAGAESSVKA